MSIFIYLGEFAFAVMILGLLLFSLFSAVEKEWRAFGRSLFVTLGFLFLNALIWMLPYTIRKIILGVFFLFLVLLFMFFIFSPKPKRRIDTKGKKRKIKVFGVQNFCEFCKKCALNCPSHAIPLGEKREENGSLRWIIDREACYEFWRKCGTDCAKCIYVCPYSKPNNLMHKIIRMANSKSTGVQKLSMKGDDFFYGTHPKEKKSLDWTK